MKCWVVGFSTLFYGDVMMSCKLSLGGNDPGPRDFMVDYKVGAAGNWNEVPNSNLITANDWETGVLENLPLPEECTNRQMVYLRWIMTSDTSTSGELVEANGKLKIDDIVISGTDVSNIEDVEWTRVSIFPNPFTENITFQNIDKMTSCRIFYITGQLVYKSEIANGQQLKLSHLKNGIYNMQLFDKKGQVEMSKKIIKQ